MILWEDNEDEYAQFYDWTNDVRRAPIGEEEGNEVYISPAPFLPPSLTSILVPMFLSIMNWFLLTRARLLVIAR